MKKLPKWAYPVAVLFFPLFMTSVLVLAALAFVAIAIIFVVWCAVGLLIVVSLNLFALLFKYKAPKWAEFLLNTNFWPLIDMIIDRIDKLFRKESIES